MDNDKQNYYKLYNDRNQLLLVTPLPVNCKKYIEKALGIKLDDNISAVMMGKSRFIEGFRINRVEI